MAFPTVVGTATNNGDSGTFIANLPAGVQAGDLIIVCWGRTAGTTFGTVDNGFLPIPGTSSVAGTSTAIRAIYKVADGTEGASIQTHHYPSGTDPYGNVTIVLRDWGDLPIAAAVSNGTTTSPNPPSLTSGYGAVDTLWLAYLFTNSSAAVPLAALPANYANETSSERASIGLSVSRRSLNAATEDPGAGTWAGGVSGQSLCITIAIRGPVAKSGSDTGSGAEARSLAVALTRSDTGAGGDVTETVGQSKTGSDSGSGSDALGSLQALLAAAEAGSGAEGLGGRTLVLTDAGAGLEGTTDVRIVVVAIDPFPVLPPTLEQVLKGHHTPLIRVTFLGNDLEAIIHEAVGAVDGGSVSIDRQRDTFREGQVRLANSGLYTPQVGGLVWSNRLVRIERGAMVGAVPQYVELLTGVVDSWKVNAFSGAVSFTVWSRLHLAQQQFPRPITFAAGTPLVVVVRTLAELGGLGTTDAHYLLDDGGAVLATSRTFDVSEVILTAMIKVAFDSGLVVYDDGHGRLVMHPFIDPLAATPIWTFTPGSDSVLLDLAQEGQAAQIYNRAVAVGTGPDRYPIRAEARVLNPNDPLYNPPDGTGPVGDRPAPTYISPDITSQQAALAVARRLLLEGALYEERLATAISPVPLVQARDVVRFTAGSVDDLYLLDKVQIPLGPGQQTMSTTKLRSLLAEAA